MTTRDDLRNVAIIAHVDHGKTTLVDAMLHQSGAFQAHQDIADRVMDSGDLEREKGITILAKNTAVTRDGITINVVDTPGHADFGGEVERALAMVDGALLLVDAAEGPLPQTRFVLRKALERDLPLVLVVNKVDRHDARADEVVNEVFDLLIDLGADDDAIDIPTVYTNAKAGHAGESPDALDDNLDIVFDTILEAIPAPSFDPDAPFNALVTTLDASAYLGRLALARIHNGTVRKGQDVAWMREDGTTTKVRLTEMFVTEALERVPATEAGPGDIIAIAGIDDVMIGDTLADLDDPRALPRLRVDEPSLGVTIGTNTGPLAGRDGDKVTARLIENRLRQELVGNVSLRVLATERPDTWEVQGRGELQLAVLVETLRREGFELTVGKPQVVLREIDGTTHEPFEALTVDVPGDHVGAVTQLLGNRNGRMTDMHHGADGWVRMTFHVPARGLIGFRTEFMTQTRGTGQAHHVFDGYEPWTGDLRTRPNGSLVADRLGTASTYALLGLQDRGEMFVPPGTDVYEGMIVGEHTRGEDLDINATREKKATNVRSSTAEELVRLAPNRELSLEQALEWIRDDEAVEVTPNHVRLRKLELDQTRRARAAKRTKWGAAPA